MEILQKIVENVDMFILHAYTCNIFSAFLPFLHFTENYLKKNHKIYAMAIINILG